MLGPLPYILTVVIIEGLKSILVFNMAVLICSYVIHFLIIFSFSNTNMIQEHWRLTFIRQKPSVSEALVTCAAD